MKNLNLVFGVLSFVVIFLCASVMNALAQTETPPAPAPPKTVTVPAVQEKKLSNGLKVAVVRRPSVPLVTVQLLIMNGASAEDENKAGLANLTADLLTKGTRTRTATQIANDMAFLGSELNTGAGWNNSSVSFTATPDKLQQALAIMADIVLNPSFKQKELDLLKSQTLDELKYNLKQPSFIASYVASKYSFGEHPAGGTPESLQSISLNDITSFHKDFYAPDRAVIIFSGDIDLLQATNLVTQTFGRWKKPLRKEIIAEMFEAPSSKPENVQANRILVVDLPNTGQAAVTLSKSIPVGRVNAETSAKGTRVNKEYYPAIVMNSVLGGGYSSRLNYEIRIKRGLSYGAGSSLGWRYEAGNFTARAQTKNVSAAEVAELTLAEIKRLTESSVPTDELVPRKSTLTGNFSRGLETTNGLASAIGELYSFDISPNELNSYVSSVNSVTDAQIRDFASKNLLGGDLIIVGDYSVFKDDLAKRFPNVKIDVIKADDLDLSKDNLRK
jgi:zinc protease